MNNSPLLSVIIPVYNVEKYLAETLDSVISQDIGFEDNIEIILINDGSTDNSETICKEYQAKYPHNITYVKQKNAGVSAARNKGIGLAKGRYVNFLDADDKWSSNAMRRAVNFMEEHGDRVDFVAAKIHFFDALNGGHPGNYKFNKARVINLDQEPDNPIFHNPTCVYKSEAIKEIDFDKNLKISEDFKFISEVLLRRKAYGVIDDATYYYRKRGDETSAIGGSLQNKAYYIDTPKLAYVPMMNAWRKYDGRVHRYMQHAILSDLRWRIPQKKQNVLTKSEQSQYKKTIYSLLRDIDDEVIEKQRGMSPAVKAFMIRIKHDGEKTIRPDGRLPRVVLDFITEIPKGKLKLEGFLEPGVDEYVREVTILTKKGQFHPKLVTRAQRSLTFLGDTVAAGAAFEVTVDVDSVDNLRFLINMADGSKKSMKLRPRRFTGLSELNTSYRRGKSNIIRRVGRSLRVRPYSKWRMFLYELVYIARIIFSWNIRSAVHYALEIIRKRQQFRKMSMHSKIKMILRPMLAIVEALVLIPRALILRVSYFMTAPYLKKPIWIISDRSNSGRDNGEAFYRYLLDTGFTDADVYFLIAKNTPDYQRIKSYGGNVLRQGSMKHYLKFLHADKIISAHADTEITNPFWRLINHYVDLFNFDFIFLQHGVIYNDLSVWLNKYEKDIKLFVTSTKKEYDSILTHPYYYDEKTVLLSGLPRHDLLQNNPKRKLIIAPTNRKPLLLPTNTLGQRKYNPDFKKSEYFQFYNKLINDDKLLRALKKQGMTGEFYLHPGHIAQLKDFKENDIIRVADFPYDYSKAISEGSVMLTDYSSVFFDFSYLKKPVVYTNFDLKSFHEGQVYEASDDFQLERDGFGPVAYNYNDTITELVNIITGGCKLSREYQKRVNNFFAHTDGNNRKRVFDAIIDLDKRRDI